MNSGNYIYNNRTEKVKKLQVQSVYRRMGT